MRRIEKGVYRHFKGKYYEVLEIAEHTETGEPYVVYKALYGLEKVYIRHYDMFASKVDFIKYPKAEQEFRFEFISNTYK